MTTPPLPRTALVTGATSGFGRATAERFVRGGWQVVATGRRAERLQALRGELGEALHPLAFDIRAPAGEAGIFADPVQHFRERQSYIVYDNIWDQFAPIEPAQVTPVHDYGTIDAAGLVFTVVPLPGVTPHHTGYALATADGTVVFSGEVIHFEVSVRADPTNTPTIRLTVPRAWLAQ